jgi:UDP-N-acetylenolpyruvoylglucosamine reductase
MFVRTGTETAHLKVINNCDEKQTPYKVIGGGNNIYYLTEERVQSIMIIQKNTMSEMVFEDENFIISSGALLFEFVLFAFDKGYDISQLAGIPGAVGGAIYGNAGAYGLKIKDILHSCTVYDHTSIHSVSAADIKLGCRTSSLKDGSCSGILLTATFSGLAPRER